MQLCNLTVRHGGDMLNTIPLKDVTPGEILVLRRIHGEDAVVDIRPTKIDKGATSGQAAVWDYLVNKYDRASAFSSAPGEEQKSLLAQLFPGAMRKLPTTLKEIGLGHLEAPASIKAAKAGAGAAALPVAEIDVDLDVPQPDDEVVEPVEDAE